MKDLYIAGRVFSRRHVLIIAEVAQTHDGSLGQAFAFIDAISRTGADAVKFQTHIAEAESTSYEPWRVRFSKQDKSRFDYWRRMEFTPVQWRKLKQHANKRGLLFLSSPFSIEAVEILNDIGMPAWKIASGEIDNMPLLRRILATKKPLLLSTGLSGLREISGVVRFVKEHKVPMAILQCTSLYPTPPEMVGLNMLPYFIKKFNCPIGLSDHSGEIFPGIAAVTLGASVIEVHVTLSKEMFGVDVPVSITIEELRTLVRGVRFIEKSINTNTKKETISRQLTPVRLLFTKSIVARTDLPAGTVLSQEHLAFKKPGTGLPIAYLNRLLKKKTVRTLRKDEQITLKDLKE